MRALLAIPARLTPLVVDVLLTSYAVKAETLHKAIASGTGAGQLAPTRARRDELLEIDELLDQLDFSPARRAVEIAGERDVLATAVHDALTDTIALLASDCDDYRRGAADLDDIAAANNTPANCCGSCASSRSTRPPRSQRHEDDDAPSRRHRRRHPRRARPR